MSEVVLSKPNKNNFETPKELINRKDIFLSGFMHKTPEKKILKERDIESIELMVLNNNYTNMKSGLKEENKQMEIFMKLLIWM